MNSHKAIRVFLLALLVLGVIGVHSVAADGPRFTLKPIVSDAEPSASQFAFVLDGQSGQTLTRTLRITNGGMTPGDVHLFPVDATTAQTSGTVYLAEPDPRNDVGAWIKLDTSDITMVPGESKDVTLTITIPASARPGQHLGGVVAADSAVAVNTAAGGATLNVKTRTVTSVQVNVPGQTVEKMTVTGVTGGGKLGQQVLMLGLRNEGTIPVSPTGTIVVTNARGEELQNISLKLDKILPDTMIEYPMEVQKTALDAGDYKANINLTFGQGSEAHSTVPFTITPAQIAQIFPQAQQGSGARQAIPPTLAAPASIRGATAVNTSPGASGALANTLQTSPIAPSLIVVAAVLGGGFLLISAVGGGILLGRRKRT